MGSGETCDECVQDPPHGGDATNLRWTTAGVACNPTYVAGECRRKGGSMLRMRLLGMAVFGYVAIAAA